MTESHKRAWVRGWIVGGVAGLLALAALVSGAAFGKVTSPYMNPRIIVWLSAAVLLVFGTLAVSRISALLAHRVTSTSLPAAGGAVRILSAAVGYLFVIFAVLAELNVPIEKLLVGAGLAGIVLGIAAQQSLGNVFAGLVLMLARPFRVGDRVRVRSGALGGVFDARVREMTLTYVTLQTEEGEYKVPNSAMLAAGVARTPRTPLPSPGAAPGSPARQQPVGTGGPAAPGAAPAATPTGGNGDAAAPVEEGPAREAPAERR